MTIGYWCVLISIIFPYIFTILAKTAPNFDNHEPRYYLEHLTGWRKRAHWTQLNSFEIMPAFTAAVIIAHQLQANQASIDKIAVAFIFSRIFYAVFYLTDKAALRSLTWFLGFVCIISLFFIKHA